MYETLKKAVCEANVAFYNAGCDAFEKGGVSQADRHHGIIAVKPALNYGALTYEKILIVSLENGEIIEGEYPLPSDFSYHFCAYKASDKINSVAHSFSPCTVAWAQSKRCIPAYGEIHKSFFQKLILCSENSASAQVGAVIKALFANRETNAYSDKALLLYLNSALCFGADCRSAVDCALKLEQTADIALKTEILLSFGDSSPLKQLVKEK